MAREVADKTGALMAGNICNTTIYIPDRPELVERCRALFTVSFESLNVFTGSSIFMQAEFFCKIQEQVQWAVEEGADYIIAETFDILGEAELALECIKAAKKGASILIF